MKRCFHVLENVSRIIEKELENKVFRSRKIKKLAEFGDFVREKTDSLYSDYLKTYLVPQHKRELESKEHLDAMRKIDPNYMRGISLNNESEPQKPNNDFTP